MATTVTTPTPAPPPFWPQSVWTSIQNSVIATAGAVRVAQNVFPGPPTPLTGLTSVPAPEFNPNTMTLTEGTTKPYVELSVEFPLTNGQVKNDPTGTAALTLSSFAARELALAEDIIFLQGNKKELLPENVNIESGAESVKDGILDLVEVAIKVKAPDDKQPTNSGASIWEAIHDAISYLTSETQSVPWALISGTAAFAQISGTVLNGNPLYNILTANNLIAGGIYGTPAMPSNTGLLIALGGQPTTIYVDTDATMEPTHKEKSGKYLFRVFERVQVVALDRRAFVRLDFSYLPEPETKKPPDSGKGTKPAGGTTQKPGESS